MEKRLSSLAKKREFDYKHDDFERVCELIYQRAGISLSDSKVEIPYWPIVKAMAPKAPMGATRMTIAITSNNACDN